MPSSFVFSLNTVLAAFLINDSCLAQERQLDSVIVTASRFEEPMTVLSAGTTVISSEQIRASGAPDLNEAIRKIGGVLGRQDLNGSSDSALDLRGFGTTSEQNLVVMVDGVRISEIGLSNALMSSIPVDSVERIELTRGGSSVLYGNGATGGTIHIITKRGNPGRLSGSASVAVGNYGQREARASISTGSESLVADISASTRHTDGYRRNGYSDQNNLNLGLSAPIDGGRIGLRTNFSRQESGLPGSLTLAQFNADPQQTTKPRDNGTVDANRYVLFMEKKIGNLDFAADLSRRTQRSVGRYPSMSYTAMTDSEADQFSPRVRHVAQVDGLQHETVAGVDLMRATRKGYGEASQDSDAIYVRHEVRASESSVAFGARRENFSLASSGVGRDFGLNAWEITAAHDLRPGLGVYAKTGRSYRVANVDESAGAVGTLAPQTSNDFEIGTQIKHEQGKLTLNWFRHDLRNEIIYNPTAATADPMFAGANVNLDPTRREGVELRVSQTLSSTWSVQTTAQHVSPTFRSGANTGKDIPLVAHNTFAARLTWTPGDGRRGDIGWQWADRQRYGNDFANSCSTRVPSFDSIDGRYAWRYDGWEFAVVGNNLTDKNYFSTAYGACRNGIYPDPGRQLQITARRDF
jgi:iron complex outermembrane receptor protein